MLDSRIVIGDWFLLCGSWIGICIGNNLNIIIDIRYLKVVIGDWLYYFR